MEGFEPFIGPRDLFDNAVILLDDAVEVSGLNHVDETPEPLDHQEQVRLVELCRVSEPPRQELFRRINMASGGTAMLVALRSALLDRIADHPELRVVDDDLLHLFSSWFNRGFLTLQQIDWRTPAFLLEKLIAYESVHAIQGWDDLRRRLEQDRRCFGFFHPALVDEPLIFVEVALVKGMAASIQLTGSTLPSSWTAP